MEVLRLAKNAILLDEMIENGQLENEEQRWTSLETQLFEFTRISRSKSFYLGLPNSVSVSLHVRGLPFEILVFPSPTRLRVDIVRVFLLPIWKTLLQ